MHGLLRRAALAVDGGTRYRLRPAGGQHGVATDVERLLGHLHDATHDHVVDLGRVELVALRHRLQSFGRQIDSVPVAELAVALPAGRADGIDDDCGGHGVSSPSGEPIGAPPVQIGTHPTCHRSGVHLAAAGAGRTAAARYGLPPMSRTGKDMDRWLGDGGMPIIAVVGGAFGSYGVDGEDLGWVTGRFTPTDMACNPHGIAQAGVHSLLLDACMNFAINAALPGRAHTVARSS